MKKYEIVYIIHPDLEGSTAKITEKVKKVIEGQNGKIIAEESWGKKKLAYEIKHNAFGIYEFVVIEIEPIKVKEVERSLRLSEEIIRSIVVLAEEKEEAQTRAPKKEVKKETPAKKKEVVKEEKPKKTKSETEKEEKERQKELDEKLKEIIGPDKEA